MHSRFNCPLLLLIVLWGCDALPAVRQPECSEEALGTNKPQSGQAFSCPTSKPVHFSLQAPFADQTSFCQWELPSSKESCPSERARCSTHEPSYQAVLSTTRRSRTQRDGRGWADMQQESWQARRASSNQPLCLLWEAQSATDQPEDEVWKGRRGHEHGIWFWVILCINPAITNPASNIKIQIYCWWIPPALTGPSPKTLTLNNDNRTRIDTLENCCTASLCTLCTSH